MSAPSWLGARRGWGTVASDLADQVVDQLTVGQGLVGEHQPVAEHVVGHVDHVGRQHVVAAPEQGQGPGAGDEARGWPGGWRRTRWPAASSGMPFSAGARVDCTRRTA